MRIFSMASALSLRKLVIFIALVAATVSALWIYHYRRQPALPVYKLDLRFTAPDGYLFCGGDLNRKPDDPPPHKLPHKNLTLNWHLPLRILPPLDRPNDPPAIFRPGPADVDVYKHLDSGRVIAAHGVIHMEGNQPVLKVDLNMEDWPPGRYVVGVASPNSPFGYCTIDFTD